MLWLNWNLLQWLGKWRNFIFFYMPVILYLKLSRNHLKPYCLKQATPRLKRLLMRTFAYLFTVKYIPGSTNQSADCLSWLGRQKDTMKLPKLHVHQITNQLSARSDSLNEMRVATQEDDELALLNHTITHGWPSTIREIPSEIQPYWTFREQLTIEDGTILKGTQIVVPHKKCQASLKLIHEGHLGLGKCKLRAKDTVYWPGFNDQLEMLIPNYELCLKYSHSKCKPKNNHISWMRNTSSSLGQACHWNFLFWRCFTFAYCGLYQ